MLTLQGQRPEIFAPLASLRGLCQIKCQQGATILLRHLQEQRSAWRDLPLLVGMKDLVSGPSCPADLKRLRSFLQIQPGCLPGPPEDLRIYLRHRK
ncbi:hypothetical protein AU476_27120 [Cupriavidus sp. UYMSc13B]|nr:hypothetical protein AU476_27120 [Cupriavidus sp. UYMSc13B]